MTKTISIRQAGPDDSELVARLIYMTMGIEADWLFGQEKRISTFLVLENLVKYRGNRMSFNLAYLAERAGRVSGLLLAHPGKLVSRLNWMTGWHLLHIFGLSATIRLVRSQSAYGDLKEAEPDEFYISNLAVFPEYQGQGIGTRLMAYAENMARKAGFKKCSLIVAFGHVNACNLYEKLGYTIIKSYLSRHPKVAEGSGGYHQMVKTLGPVPDMG